ncbi:MAPEG family protein [Novosphingobium rosa]|uniref:MAPEG family protein n=1 Tax=Novosphingobium rosa TaxID=76978 RepID=UPI0008305980|nr:MAPEG family protein [Novosphingobium rosa]
MRLEFIMLGAVIGLALVNILWAANVRTRQYGVAWNLGARDAPMPPPSALVQRLQRAQANLYETLPLWIGALLGAAAQGHLGWKTQAGAALYAGARVVYLPLYAAGVPVVRTVVWLVSLAGLLLTLWALIAG